MEKEENIDLLEKYYSNTLSDEEKEQIEYRIEEDSTFAKEMEDYLVARSIIQSVHREDISKKVDRRFRELNQKKNQSITPIRFLMMAAATLLVLFGVTRFYTDSDTLSGEDLFNQYFALPEVSAVRSGDLTDDQWSLAVSQFESGNFSEAIAEITPFTDTESSIKRDQAFLYLGICHLQVGQFNEAKESLTSISEDSSLVKEGQWYTALAHLKSGDIEECKKVLQNIINSTWHPKIKQAENLIKKLS